MYYDFIKMIFVNQIFRKYVLVCIGLLCCIRAYSQYPVDCKPIEEARKNPDSVVCLYLDLNTDDIRGIPQLVRKTVNLKKVWIYGLSDTTLSVLNEFKNITSLTISDAIDINLNYLVSTLKNLVYLDEIVFDGNQFQRLPSDFTKLSQIRKIIITDNEDLDIENTVEILAQMPNLTYVGLPINQLLDLPDNIGKLNQIAVLDISNNYLDNLPGAMGKLKSLDTLNVEGNVLINPVDDLKSMRKLKIRYLTVDESLDNETLDKLKKIFPKSTIESRPAIINPPKSDQVPVTTDSVVFEPPKTPEVDTTTIYGEFKVEKTSFKVYSDAYTHYADIFLKNEPPPFDSTLFDQRFESLKYRNNKSVRLGSFGFIRLLKYDKKRLKGCFTLFAPGDLVKYINENYKELSVYLGVKWKYLDKMNRSQFKKKFLGTRSKPVYWNDIKIVPAPGFEYYNMVLKSDTGFTVLKCFPFVSRKPDKDWQSEKVRKSFLKRYLKYMKYRTRRAALFNRDLIKEKTDYETALRNDLNGRWLSFQQMYMAPDERKLNHSQWMLYYQQVMLDEPAALLNSEVSYKTVKRAVEAHGYVTRQFSEYLQDSTSVANLNVKFTDTQGKNVCISKIIAINKTDHSYSPMAGSYNYNAVTMLLPDKAEMVMVVETITGIIGVIEAKSIKDKVSVDGIVVFPVTFINSKIATVSQVFNVLGL